MEQSDVPYVHSCLNVLYGEGTEKTEQNKKYAKEIVTFVVSLSARYKVKFFIIDYTYNI